MKGFTALAADQAAAARAHFEAGLPLASENPALQSDVRKVLVAMNEQIGPHASPIESADESPEETPANHVLLSNYSGGTVH